MFLNADLLESIEATPDTVLTLVDGRRIVVVDDELKPDQRLEFFRWLSGELEVARDGIDDRVDVCVSQRAQNRCVVGDRDQRRAREALPRSPLEVPAGVHAETHARQVEPVDADDQLPLVEALDHFSHRFALVRLGRQQPEWYGFQTGHQNQSHLAHPLG